MSCVLVTGAGRGIGREFVRQYAAAGWNVLATCRRPELADDLCELGPGISSFALDATDPQSIGCLAERLRGVAIDLLINSAGVHGAADDPLGAIDFGAWEDAFRVNAIAPLRMAEAFRSHLGRSRLRLMVGIGSRMGSIAMNNGGGAYFHRASEAASNAIHRSLAIDLAPDGIVAVVLCPDRARPDLASTDAPGPLAGCVADLRRVIGRLTPVDSGRFLDRDGRELPW